ncbi:UNVERIFIED_CONTAM: hypothetical protein BJ099_10515 [Lysinibacillus xylanilyticus]|uniref:hypothetical protein n=1 Tax=Lysinibacillus xylanilyticus TaxID=582475 RepID=UPI0010F10382|nr:hypothetical protein [Lysinibacillus xylanilyticus]
MGNRTSTEIEELSLRTPSLVLIYLRESEAAAAITPRRNLIGGSLAWKKQLYGTK